ncbi:hypothetical protein DPMN_033424 [Dreissena polymorpha]|uniref:Uncharacterized protein n=1 Tax=Dreissena polymorpha TaxID=45954 RepID=A0A9D4RKY6_DREPO|nr:hypothetical protein DPMN_033424 [Dreissena polymorpha]
MTNTIEQSSDIGDQQTAQLGAGDSGLEFLLDTSPVTNYSRKFGLDTRPVTNYSPKTARLSGQSGCDSCSRKTGPNTLTLKTVCACPGACNEAGPLNPCTGGGGGGGGISGGKIQDGAWAEITEKVNSIDDVKESLTMERKNARQTGGGHPMKAADTVTMSIIETMKDTPSFSGILTNYVVGIFCSLSILLRKDFVRNIQAPI